MTVRSILLTATLAVIPAGLAACSQEAPSLTDATVELALVPGADHGGRPFTTAMTQEVTTVPVFSGDPDGSGVALITVNLGQREVCWQIAATDILLPASSAHIHQAAPGVRGNIVVALSPPNATGSSVGCSSGIDAALLREIITNPQSFYVNVHTSQFPAGAIRGQLPE